jgi:hypothetical protein
VGLASSWLLLGEPLTVMDVAGAVLTFAGIIAVSLVPERPIVVEPSPYVVRTETQTPEPERVTTGG